MPVVRDVLVIGNGMFGAAATKYLAQGGLDVACLGARPTDRVEGASTVFSSHNDAARLARYQSRDTVWSDASRQALARFPDIERESGIDFYDPVGCLIASAPGGDGINPDPRDNLELAGIDHDFYDVGDRSWQSRWPALDFPDSHWVAYEPAPAGLIRPLDLVRAQNRLAEAAGATLIEGVATGVEPLGRGEASGAGFEVTASDGTSHRAGRVLVAAGGFSNLHGLVPQPVPVELKTEVVVLGQVSDADAEWLSRMPTLKYLVHDERIEGIYQTPAARYPDGRHYIKLGANTSLDTRWAPGAVDLATLQRWFSTDTDPDYLPIFQPHLEALWPNVEFVSFTTKPCLITYTGDGRPLIEQVGDGLFVATGGNGAGAKSSDTWGLQAAELLSAT